MRVNEVEGKILENANAIEELAKVIVNLKIKVRLLEKKVKQCQ